MTIKVTYNITDVYVTQDVSPVYINVSYSSGGGSGAAVWGGITGTLSDQTDLQTALDGKFDDPTGTSSQYIDGTGALQTFPLTLPVLQEVRNQTGATLDAGTVVYINGATGNKPTVTKAIATGDATSAQTLGMVSAAIANNGTGYVVVIGTCSGLDTSAYTEGQQLYLSYTTAGAVTTTKPYAPYHLVYVGIVTRSHPTLGTIEVRVQNGFEVAELHDVSALSPNNNDGLFYNTSTSLWEHKQISTALGYTPANSATTLTINGVTYDLSTSRTFSVGSVTGSGASGQVAYWTGTSAQSGSNNLFWDNANGRLGIGTNAPAFTLEMRGARFYHTGTTTTAATTIYQILDNTTVNNSYVLFGVDISNVTGFSQEGTYLSTGRNGTGTLRPLILHNYDNQPIIFATSNQERMRLDGSGNLLIGATNISSARGGSGTKQLIKFGTSQQYLELQANTTSTTSGLLFSDGSTGNFGLVNYTSADNMEFYTAANERMRLFSTGNLALGSTTDSGERLQVTGTGVIKDIVTSSVASALFQLSSTTKGFLPPRMTTTQKNAISSPAAGLVVYDTTLAKLCVYTTAWETITSV